MLNKYTTIQPDYPHKNLIVFLLQEQIMEYLTSGSKGKKYGTRSIDESIKKETYIGTFKNKLKEQLIQKYSGE